MAHGAYPPLRLGERLLRATRDYAVLLLDQDDGLAAVVAAAAVLGTGRRRFVGCRRCTGRPPLQSQLVAQLRVLAAQPVEPGEVAPGYAEHVLGRAYGQETLLEVEAEATGAAVAAVVVVVVEEGWLLEAGLEAALGRRSAGVLLLLLLLG